MFCPIRFFLLLMLFSRDWSKNAIFKFSIVMSDYDERDMDVLSFVGFYILC